MHSSRCGHSSGKGKNHFPSAAGQTFPDAGQENVGAEMAEKGWEETIQSLLAALLAFGNCWAIAWF